jgi:hypothetical protein
MGGCGHVNVDNIFQQDTKYIELSKFTRRGDIVNSLETVALINATYLNPISHNDKYEVFIVGVYNNYQNNGQGIFNKAYHLTLNNQPFIKATPLTTSDIKDYPFYNKWMKYYKVYFKHTDKHTLQLKYACDRGDVVLNFEKEN